MARSTVARGAALLKEWRDKKGLSQAAACEVMGLDPATYNGIEHGRIKVGFKRAFAIEQGTGGAVPMQVWATVARKRAA
jgi:transcriptional regulator with XRE-family HTH domain